MLFCFFLIVELGKDNLSGKGNRENGTVYTLFFF
jgi:hypothetical protein